MIEKIKYLYWAIYGFFLIIPIIFSFDEAESEPDEWL